MEFDFEGIIEKAVDWLYIPITEESVGDFGIPMHPFFESIFLADNVGMFNVLEDEQRLLNIQHEREKNIRQCKDIRAILMMIRKAYRIFFLDELYEDELADAQYCGNALGSMWSLLENNDSTDMATKEHMLEWLLAADKEKLMDEKDLKFYNSLPDSFVVYRGVQPEEGIKGFSWSMNPKTAEWFAKRFNMTGDVYKLQVNKAVVIAYIDNRNEEEIIVDYTKIGEPVVFQG